MVVLQRLASAAAVLAMSALAACSDSVSPDDVSPANFATSLTGAASTFNNNAAFQSLATLSGLFPQYAAVAALRAGLPAPPALKVPAALAGARARAGALRLFASLRVNPQALFPANVLGKTLEWDGQTQTYIVGTVAGAPTNGIRILLYTVNTVSGAPTTPLQQLGYVDLTDESTPAADQLGVLLTLGTTTIADYTLSVVQGTSISTLEAEGFIRNAQGTGQVNFDFTDVANTTLQTYTSTSKLTSADGVSIFVEVQLSTTTVTLTIRVQEQNNKLEISVTVDDVTSAVAGSVKYNGTKVATITGDVGAPIFTAVSGRTLSAPETTSLTSIFATAVDVATNLGEAVYGPGGVVFTTP